MFVDRAEVNERLNALRGTLTPQRKAELYAELEKKYNIPAAIAGMYYNQMRQFDEATDYLAYCFMDILNPNGINKYFTPKEIKAYSKMKYGIGKIKFPYVFKNMTMITDDQWIGGTTLQELMKFRNSSLINYNEETQRPMTAVVNGGEITFKITINKKSVDKIADSMLKRTYVPDDITINIPEECPVDYEDGELIIPELDHMDILDGYHRWVAMSRINNSNPTFNYPMEIRITHFSTEKARYYIYQKEQKNRMKRDTLQMYNQYDPGIVVCNKINQNSLFDLQGKIGTDIGMIPISDFAKVIDIFYFPNSKNDMIEIVCVSKEIMDKFNLVIESNPTLYFKMTYNFRRLYALLYAFVNVSNANDLPGIVDKLIKKADETDTNNKNKLNSLFDSVLNKRGGDDAKKSNRSNV